jgi:outer membrane protein
MKRLHLTLALLYSAVTAQAQDLLQTYDQALERDPTVREARAKLLAAEEYRPQAIAKLLPQITASANLMRNTVLSKLPANANPTQTVQSGGRNIGFWTSAGTLSLQQAIYHHDHWVTLSQADNLQAQSEAEHEGALQLLGTRLASTYFDVLYAQDNLGFSRSEKKATERQLEQAKARFEVGLIAITDVNVAQAAFDKAVADEIKAENDLDNAQEAVREIVGELSDNLANLAEDSPLAVPDPNNLEEWDKRSQSGNLAIIAAENEAEAARKTIQIKYAGHLPTFDIVGTAGFTDTNRPFGIGTESQVIGLQANLPLFQGGYVSSQVTQARHLLEAAQERLEKQKRAVAKTVKNAYRGIMSSIAKVEALRAAVVSSQSALEATEAGFEVGTRTMVEVLTEQKNLFGAKRDLARARYDYIVNSLVLKQTAGILQRDDIERVNHWLKAATAEPSSAPTSAPE